MCSSCNDDSSDVDIFDNGHKLAAGVSCFIVFPDMVAFVILLLFGLIIIMLFVLVLYCNKYPYYLKTDKYN